MAIPQINQYDDLRKEVARRYEQLHPDIKAALISVDTAGMVYEIGKKFELNIEKTGYLADVIGYTMIGLLPVADFMQNLKNALVVDSTKAEEISREVNNKIFLAIREQLKKTHGEKWDERAMTKEIRDQRLETKETMPTQPTASAQPMPTTQKNPWEIKPEGMTQETRDKRQEALRKSVIPPLTELTTNNLQPTIKAEVKQEVNDKKQETTPPEPPKTRESPQPAPAPHAPEILKEIKPVGQPTTDIKQLTTTSPTSKPEMPKTTPPADLPFMKEVGKLTQTPELNKPTTDNPQPKAEIPPMPKPGIFKPQQVQSAPQPPQQTSAPTPEAGNMNKESGIRETPQPAPAPKPQTPIQTPTSAPKYAIDPYREPIE